MRILCNLRRSYCHANRLKLAACPVQTAAGVAARAEERKKRERLCRYISRPPVAEKRLSLTAGGNVRYRLKTPYRDGTTHVIFEPLDFIARLAALVPRPRVNLSRYRDVFAPNSRERARMTHRWSIERHRDQRGNCDCATAMNHPGKLRDGP